MKISLSSLMSGQFWYAEAGYSLLKPICQRSGLLSDSTNTILPSAVSCARLQGIYFSAGQYKTYLLLVPSGRITASMGSP